MQQQSEQNQQIRAPPENSKLGNVTVLTATSTTAASNSCSDNLLAHNSETLGILTQFCNEKPSKYRNLVKICNELVKKVKNMFSLTGTRVVRSNSCKGPAYPGKGPKSAKGPNEDCGARKCYLGPNFWNLAPKGLTWQPCVDVSYCVNYFCRLWFIAQFTNYEHSYKKQNITEHQVNENSK